MHPAQTTRRYPLPRSRIRNKMRAATSSPQIADLLRELEACTERAQAVVFGLTPEEIVRRPGPKSWSIAEILEHLSATTRAYLPPLDRAAGELRDKGRTGSGPYAFDWIGRFMIWSLEPPPRFKMRAPGVFVPLGVAQPEAALSTFAEMQGELVRRVLSLDGLALDSAKVVSPAAKVLRFNVWSALKMLSAHERRHLAQAEAVKRELRAN